jgi:hypothetical protein
MKLRQELRSKYFSPLWTGRKVWLKIVASVGRNASFLSTGNSNFGGLNLSAKGSLKGSPFVGCVRLAQKSAVMPGL